MQLELNTHKEILEFSLRIEEAVNYLLMACLSITDKSQTKNFGNKAGISFKSKIDLLFDIGVLSKEEHFDLELQMIFRNKFLHDIECVSFSSVLGILDNGIKNKFRDFLNENSSIENEEACKGAYRKLYRNNVKTIREKFKDRRVMIEKKSETLKNLLSQHEKTSDIAFELIDDILKLLEKSELENPEVFELAH